LLDYVIDSALAIFRKVSTKLGQHVDSFVDSRSLLNVSHAGIA
jgi:hypothetical protein